MSNGTIFFSYSRADEAFVLDLAKRLRSIGANIWIDQLDIEAGRNWDNSVESALESSDSVLVVLSKSSVASRNVMDEVSIALEEGKKVIPVLFEECKRPFRLKRLHYVDFTKDQERGFQTLVSSLRLNQDLETGKKEAQPVSEAPVAKASQDLEAEKAKKEEERKLAEAARIEAEKKRKSEEALKKKEQEIRRQAEKEAEERLKKAKQKKSNPGVLIAVVALVVLVGAGGGWYYFMGPGSVNDDESTEAQESLVVDTEAAEVTQPTSVPAINEDDASYDQIKAMTDFRVFSDHMEKMDSCRHMAAIDDKFWSLALDSTASYSLENYQVDFSEGAHLEEAGELLEAIAAEKLEVEQDSLAWTAAKDSGTLSALLSYVANDSLRGSYRNEALDMAASNGKNGWLFCGKTQNESAMNPNGKILKVLWSESQGDLTNKIPAPNDIVRSLSSRYTYKDPETTERTGYTFKKDHLGRVREVKIFGNTVIVHVLYD